MYFNLLKNNYLPGFKGYLTHSVQWKYLLVSGFLLAGQVMQKPIHDSVFCIFRLIDLNKKRGGGL
jgi:hypothetical protein